MTYLGLAFSVLWVISFGYLFVLDGQIRALKRRLQARHDAGSDTESMTS